MAPVVMEDLFEQARQAVSLQKSEVNDHIVQSLYEKAEQLARQSTDYPTFRSRDWNRVLDDVFTSPLFGLPTMVFLLAAVLWLTISGANVPSRILAGVLFWFQDQLTALCLHLSIPAWVHGFFVLGVYRSLAWVVSVMLPPMAIFFPLFTLLEDAGFLPRVAFNLDSCFKRVGAHGKQALTMCMGFGCNAAGITSCRIIDSPRERLIAALTNNFVPCNGRFPTLIALATIFVGGTALFSFSGIAATAVVTGLIILGVVITLAVSLILSKTVLKGQPSSFTLELPPYRRPKIGEVVVRSILDRTLFVLARAAIIAAPAGGLVWILANTQYADTSVLSFAAAHLDPMAKLMGLDGFILLAFILGLPANEIVFPILIMSYVSGGTLMELDSLAQLKQLLVNHGWTWLTALCVMVFSLCHWPCGTTLLTIRKELNSWKWAGAALLIPTLTGFLLCALINAMAHLLGWA